MGIAQMWVGGPNDRLVPGSSLRVSTTAQVARFHHRRGFDAGDQSKNREARHVPFARRWCPRLVEILAEAVRGKQPEDRLFRRGKHNDVEVKRFDKLWRTVSDGGHEAHASGPRSAAHGGAEHARSRHLAARHHADLRLADRFVVPALRAPRPGAAATRNGQARRAPRTGATGQGRCDKTGAGAGFSGKTQGTNKVRSQETGATGNVNTFPVSSCNRNLA